MLVAADFNLLVSAPVSHAGDRGLRPTRASGTRYTWTRLFLHYVLRLVMMDVLLQSIPGASSSIVRSRINTTSLWSLFNPLRTWRTTEPSLCRITWVTPDLPHCASVSVWDFCALQFSRAVSLHLFSFDCIFPVFLAVMYCILFKLIQIR